MEAFQVGVSLMLTSNVAHAATDIARAFSGIHLRVRDAERALAGLDQRAQAAVRSFIKLGNTIGQSLVVAGAGAGLLKVMDQLITKAEKFNHEISRLTVMNIGAERMAQVQARAFEVTDRVKGVTKSDAIAIYGQTQGIFGHEDALKLMESGSKYVKASAAFSGKPGDFDKGLEDYQKLIRSGEMMGRITDPKTHGISLEKLEAFQDMVFRLKAMSHGMINENEILNYANKAGLAARSLSDQGMMEELAMIPIMKGHAAGTAAMSSFQQFRAGRMPVAVARAMVRYGILKPDAVREAGGSQAEASTDPFTPPNVHGTISGMHHASRRARAHGHAARGPAVNVTDDAYADPEIAEAKKRSPVAFISKILEKLIKAGVTDLDEQVRVIAQLTGRSTTFRREAELLTNTVSILREVHAANKTQGVDEAIKTFDARDLGTARANLSKAWDTLIETFVGPDSKAFLSVLNATTDALRRFDGVLRQIDPGTLDTVTSGLIALSGVLIAGGALRLAIGVGGWMLGGFGALGGLLTAGGALAIAIGPAGWLVVGLAAVGTAAWFARDKLEAWKPAIWEFIDTVAKGADNLKVAILSWYAISKAYLGEKWEQFTTFAVSTVSTFATDLVTEIKSWPARLLGAIEEFGRQFIALLGEKLKNLFSTDPNSPLQRFDPKLLIPGSFSGADAGGHSWSDIGQGVPGSGAAGPGGAFAGGPSHFGSRARRGAGMPGSVGGAAARGIGAANSNIAAFGGGAISGLTPESTSQYANILGHRESGNNYGIRNRFGYSGRFQFGQDALAEIGLMSQGNKHNAGMGNPAMWTGKYGVHNLQEFLSNPAAQNQAFTDYTNMHHRQLVAAGVIKPGMSQQQTAGWLAAAHLKGVGGAIKLARGQDNSDAYGTRASSYFNMMKGIGGGGLGVPANDNVGRMVSDFGGLRLKSREAVAGGGAHEGVVALAKAIQSEVPGFLRFSAINDRYHHHANSTSLHAKGLALDFPVTGDHRAATAQVRSMLGAAGLSPKDYQLINEYDHPSRGSTGGHIHAGFRSQAAADRFRQSRVPPPAGNQPVRIHNDVHMDGRKVSSGVTRHQGSFANGASHGGHGFDPTAQFAGPGSRLQYG